jgi:hypothetical protein
VAHDIRSIELWARHAERAVMREALPWTGLLAGMASEAMLRRDQVQRVACWCSQGLQRVFMADLDDGLAREQVAPRLRVAA